MKSLRAALSILASKFTRFETVSGYVTFITVYNSSCTLLNIYVPSRCRRLNTLDHRAGWSPEVARWLNGQRLGLGLGNAIVLFFPLILQNMMNIFASVASYGYLIR